MSYFKIGGKTFFWFKQLLSLLTICFKALTAISRGRLVITTTKQESLVAC